MLKPKEKRTPTFAESVLAIGVLVVLIAIGYIIFEWPVAMVMIAASVIAALLAYRCGYTWKELDAAISAKFTSIISIIIILFFLGAVVASFVACGLMSCVTGGSWSTAATMGMAMFGVATAMNANLTITAAAAISGSSLGTKCARYRRPRTWRLCAPAPAFMSISAP